MQVVNFGNQAVNLNISVTELGTGIKKSGSKQMVLTSSSPVDENSFQQPEKVSARTESVTERQNHGNEWLQIAMEVS